MRNFVVSDLHGNGYVYDSIINFLENEKEYGCDDITLYINGDLIDRGINSGSMLVDVLMRINDLNSINIEYLAGNHELMMYHSHLATKDLDYDSYLSEYKSASSFNWICNNGGFITKDYLLKNYSKESISKLIEDVGYLNIYHKFDKAIDDLDIILVHACPVRGMTDNKKILLNENSPRVDVALWARKEDLIVNKIFNPSYLNIIGHTANKNKYGFSYDKNDNVLNIDGASSLFGYIETSYVQSLNKYILFDEYELDIKNKLESISHIPLIEIDSINNRINILVFNHLNQIIYGKYLQEGIIYDMESNLLNSYRKNLKENVKVKKRKV
ncbi:MAG: metallophosphoesterase [Bacilli bacterium]|nr:metallophosphoesterase [Bacilli bacterium]